MWKLAGRRKPIMLRFGNWTILSSEARATLSILCVWLPPCAKTLLLHVLHQTAYDWSECPTSLMQVHLHTTIVVLFGQWILIIIQLVTYYFKSHFDLVSVNISEFFNSVNVCGGWCTLIVLVDVIKQFFLAIYGNFGIVGSLQSFVFNHFEILITIGDRVNTRNTSWTPSFCSLTHSTTDARTNAMDIT